MIYIVDVSYYPCYIACFNDICALSHGTGSFMGARAKVRLNMEEIGLFKLNDHSAYTVHNWNGDLSPVVHQYDRHDQYKGKFDQEMTPLVGSRRYYEKQGLPFPFQK